MPTKIKKQPVKKSTNSAFDFQKLIQNSDSYKSLIYGIVTVVVLFIVIVLGVRTMSQNKAEIDNQAAMTAESDDVLTSGYRVSDGETLWSIAEKSYNNGYAWTEIAKANNLSEPYVLEKGQKLVIPKKSDKTDATISTTPIDSVSPTAIEKLAQAKAMEIPTSQKIAGTIYKVVSGDNLWDIAIRSYGDGYRWVEIAKLNNLTNPDLIFSENILKLPRP